MTKKKEAIKTLITNAYLRGRVDGLSEALEKPVPEADSRIAELWQGYEKTVTLLVKN